MNWDYFSVETLKNHIAGFFEEQYLKKKLSGYFDVGGQIYQYGNCQVILM